MPRARRRETVEEPKQIEKGDQVSWIYIFIFCQFAKIHPDTYLQIQEIIQEIPEVGAAPYVAGKHQMMIIARCRPGDGPSDLVINKLMSNPAFGIVEARVLFALQDPIIQNWLAPRKPDDILTILTDIIYEHVNKFSLPKMRSLRRGS